MAHNLTDTDAGLGTDAVSTLVTRPRVDRTTVSDRDWLEQLDDQLESLFQRLDADAAARRADRQEWEQRLHVQRDEIRKATRRGWELIVTGIGFTAIGTLLQLWM